MVSECDLDIQDIFWKVSCQLIILSFFDIYWYILQINARSQRALARRNRYEAVEEVPAEPREENPAESDTEEDILEEQDQVPLHILIPDARGRGGPPAAEVPAAIDPGMWLNMVNVKPPHFSDLEVESMNKFILDHKRYSQKCPRQ